MSDPLAAFLRECLDEDARMALAAKNALDEWQAGNDPAQRWSVDHDAPLGVYVAGEWCCVGEGVAAHIGAQSPEQRLAEVESKRKILETCATLIRMDRSDVHHDAGLAPTRRERHNAEWFLRLMTAPYRDRPGYDPTWGGQ